ncbi:hypothetical protein [Pseudovibrio sp. POLY-S9]|uniref:ORC-CDC6 family AAA ATPase n=1 Tax=Pseudovibrio sp. POLY-S9 TaxID=1576596 RepID=UPI00070970D2|nr:hypothetical protein [Pseudovibrio sp. POLY-S9]
MPDFFYRTEDISAAEILGYFVETKEDRSVVDQLKGRNPAIVVGSRGVGKSFLMRVAEQELKQNFDEERVLPVYITFVSSSLIRTDDPDQFRNWMLARICSAVLRTVQKFGLMANRPPSANILAGLPANHLDTSNLEKIIQSYEASWKNPGEKVDTSGLPDIEAIKFALEDLAEETGVRRFSLFMDEAAHIFLPSQQRQFFTLFRDLRCPTVTCNAAVYPGVTSFGDTFQPNHDATIVSLNREVGAKTYISSMLQIVEKQADTKLLTAISKSNENFSVLAFAATGNPRVLLKTVSEAPKMNSSEVNGVVREYYRSGIWSEHSLLSEKYLGHKEIIDWGRNFLEDVVLPELKKKNDGYLSQEKNTTSYIWVHRDAPQLVKEALRILCYTGVLTEHASGIRATRNEIGKRYIVNLGCLFALETTATGHAFKIATSLTPKRMSEFGAKHGAFSSLIDLEIDTAELEEGFDLNAQLAKPNSKLDVTDWQLGKLNELKLYTIGHVFAATESKLKEAYLIGDVRARRMKNAAVYSVLEYLSG